jgi:hypothetical protein
MQTQHTPIIAYHNKSELRGWNEVCRYPADWEGWNAYDRSMIQELINQGEFVVTSGWSMYQVVKG